ncbi:GyrI-like domain-containing protein [Streptomyces sp. P38-E01]|uniref:GyrI-like domain-containing protein n=1 Tax=Streptomyces tardus TaxID=2780544 RepID=A0A949JG31_9ACTN|nr:GyrI-like domain-containing protein [Streptomyces tardus]MBU7597869.1 GyrI-like domain-containing protein [Streptomyces tardus]
MPNRPAAEPEIVEIAETPTVVVRDRVAFVDFPEFFDRSFPLLADAVVAQGLTITGPAFSRYHGEITETADVEAGFPVDRAPEPDGRVTASTLPGGRVARLVHVGSYDGLPDAWAALGSWIAGRELAERDDFWEVYTTEPTPETDPADLHTELNRPLA